MPAYWHAAVQEGTRVRLTPATRACCVRPLTRHCTAKWAATRDEEHAVSVLLCRSQQRSTKVHQHTPTYINIHQKMSANVVKVIAFHQDVT